MRSSRWSRPLLLSCALLALAPPSPHAAQKPYRIAGAQRGEDRKWAPLEVLEESQGGVTCQIKYLDTEARRAAIASGLGTPLDLFPVRGADEKRTSYLVFVLQMTNNSAEDVTFNPTQSRLSSEKGDMEFALDYTAVYERLRLLGDTRHEMDDVAKVLFDRVVTLRPGGSARKLLAFEAPREDRYRTLELRLVEVNIGTAGVDFVFPFRKFYQ
jgi:hypothetical protein